MQQFLAATRRLLATPRGDGAIGHSLALIVACFSLVAVLALSTFLRYVSTPDTQWPDATPLSLFLIQIGQALGIG